MPLHAFPEPTIFTPSTGEPALRWGLVGPGGIAAPFVRAVHAHTAQRFTAVASRSAERAASFAAEHGIDSSYGSIDELAASPSVDVVYIASPPGPHLDQALAVIAAGKHVLIEKPFTATAAEARTLADAARAAGVLAMEAMWTRYLPQSSVIDALLADGALGDVRAVEADHGQAINPGPEHRMARADIGGGALLDLAVYPVAFASQVFGAPSGVTAVGGMTESGVDAYSSMILTYEGAQQSTLTTTMLTRTPNSAVIAGSEARLELASVFYTPTNLTLSSTSADEAPAVWTDPTGVAGYEALSWEATALAQFVGEGRTESPVHTLDETIAVLQTIDDVRAQVEAQARIVHY